MLLNIMNELEDFVSLATREFKRLKDLSDRAVAQISEDQFFFADSEGDNSVAQIYKHMAGNIRSRWTDFLTTDGEKPDRNRDTEFVIAETDTYLHLHSRWESAWKILFDTLSDLKSSDLSTVVRIRGEGLTVLQAISRQLTHYAYHVGQIVYIAKRLAEENWTSLSIPKGESAAFNQAPDRYLESE